MLSDHPNRIKDIWIMHGLSYSQRVLAVSMLLLVCACNPIVPVVDTPKTSTVEPVQPAYHHWLEIFFTDPGSANAINHEAGPDKSLAAAIGASRASVDVAVYNLNLWSIRNALLDAHARGVVVRVVAESDNLDGEEFQDLIEAGIPVLGDRSESLMHNKFVIIDRSEVWTGSMNFTLNGAYDDNNNLLHIASTRIAEDYLVEFNEMFEQDLFGPKTIQATPNPTVNQDGTLVEVFFSPDDAIQERLVELIDGARQSINFLAYSFTADPLGEAIRQQASAGVSISGVMDYDQVTSNSGSEFDRFIQAGLDVRLDGNDGQMHDKVIIIDSEIVITGSYNFTASAEERNDENVLIIHDADVAAVYLAEFWKVQARAIQP
jgi:phosphatidylserine/phosphatidylglycerophosphate/cardiolipin synthase-like enzyme